MRKISSLLIIISGILWGSMGIFVRQFNKGGLASMEISGIRSFGAGLFIVIALFVWKRELLKIKPKDIWVFLGSGLLSVLCFNYCYFKTISLTSMAVAAVLLYTSPMIVMILSVCLFHEKLTPVKIVALLISFSGCVLVSGAIGGQTVLTPQGLLTGIGAGFSYALYTIFSRYGLQKGYHPLTIVAYTFLISGLGILPLCKTGTVIQILAGDKRLLLLAVAFAVISTVFPYFLYTIALSYTEAGKAAIMASTEPVAAAVFGVVLFHEKMTINIFLGILCVLSSLLILNIKIMRRNPGK